MPPYEISKPRRAIQSAQAPLLTLDTNCLISLAKNQPDAVHVKRLVLRHRANEVALRLVAVSGSERGPYGEPLASYDHFQRFVDSLGMSDVPILLPLAIYGVAYWGHAIYGDNEGTMAALLDSIWTILFGSTPRMLAADTPD